MGAIVRIKELKASDVGRGVMYVGGFSFCGRPTTEPGVISSWNEEYVFVRYVVSETSRATLACDLEWLPKTETGT